MSKSHGKRKAEKPLILPHHNGPNPMVWVYFAGPAPSPDEISADGKPAPLWIGKVIQRLFRTFGDDRPLLKGDHVCFIFDDQVSDGKTSDADAHPSYMEPIEQSDVVVGYLRGAECARAVAALAWAMRAGDAAISVAEVLDSGVPNAEGRYCFLRREAKRRGHRAIAMDEENLDAVAEMAHVAISEAVQRIRKSIEAAPPKRGGRG